MSSKQGTTEFLYPIAEAEVPLNTVLRVGETELHFEPAAPAEGAPLELPEGVTLEQMMEQVERQLIESTLRRCGNHRDRAAKQLGLARSSLFKRLKEWGVGEGEE